MTWSRDRSRLDIRKTPARDLPQNRACATCDLRQHDDFLLSTSETTSASACAGGLWSPTARRTIAPRLSWKTYPADLHDNLETLRRMTSTRERGLSS